MLRQTISRPVCLGVKTHLRPKTRFYYCQTVTGSLIWGALSDERTGLSFTIAAGPLQVFSSPISAGLITPFCCLIFETPQPGGPGPRIYILQEQRGPVLPPGTVFPFRCLLPPGSHYVLDTDRIANTASSSFFLCVRKLLSDGAGIVACLHSCCLVMTFSLAPLSNLWGHMWQ
jgi:hypothetical protein